ncbi:SDR family oxidoreductase [Kocuria rhizophila]|uniref:SDR family NAD(P)-dependent oxidoreductase n=1 Tax=Kocuria TaxID=57493 RepID=UPI0003054C4E|nr:MULTISPECIES: SDR family oxidoreductase [Kocuria]WIW67977.1 SDR family oxidoreductase [Kocuria sp. ChxB]MCR4526705.1 SDR family oxidoreductase [Kocuria rhizophila]MCT1545331.1 SDR family oxidoreductase [Kocuria rhizophila]MCT1917791.1 SDR family oxidoreductase [Kocuria rhizophila]MCT2172711.1 SDR family oxidoreductase [Kocuria rhizophila]
MLTALVTGGTSGIGAAFARSLARRGFNLILVARDEDRLARTANDLTDEHGIHVETVGADLAVAEDLARVARRIEDPDRPVDMVVNNAGFSVKTPYADKDFARHEMGFDVMCAAVARLSGAAARAMTARGTGWIVNVSSVSGYVTMGEYSAIKAYATSMTESLAVELHGTGVQVTALLPGWVRTEFHSRAGIAGSSIPDFMWLDADRLAEEALADIARGKVISIPTLRYKVMATTMRHLPRPAVRWVSRQISGIRRREIQA